MIKEKKYLILALVFGLIGSAYAQITYPYTFTSTGNPIINHIYTADPSPKVFSDGKLWLYASHDANDAIDYSTMDGYHIFSTEDLKTWTDHGEVLHSRDVPWGIAGGGWMWAPDGVEKNGKYYIYFPHQQKTDSNGNNYWRIGVAIADKPEGPYIPEPNYIQGTGGTDPMCFIDDDGTAYLLFGKHKIAKLKPNMTELAETPRTISYGATNFHEGSYMHKRNGKYYFSYTNFEDPTNQGFYAIGDSPYGPFTYKGAVGPRPDGAQDHHSIVNFKDQWYYFYHIGGYNTANRWNRRRVCIDYLCFNADGTMNKVTHTTTGVGKAGIDRLCKESVGNNIAPTVNLTAPANNATFIAPASVTLTATATDSDGTISNVKFYNGTTLLSTDATSPYSFTWINVGLGTYTITAVATDDDGATNTSAIVSIQVEAAVAISDITNLTATATSCTNISLKWGDVSQETGYRIRRKLATQSTYTNIADVPANTTSYIDTKAQPGTNYNYMVRPVQNGVAVKISNVVSVKTPSCSLSRLGEVEASQTTLLVYPSPAKDYVIVEGVKAESLIQLYSLEGVLLSATRNTNKIDLSSLPAGIYIIKAEGKSHKVIKE